MTSAEVGRPTSHVAGKVELIQLQRQVLRCSHGSSADQIIHHEGNCVAQTWRVFYD